MSGYVLVDKNVEYRIGFGDDPKIYRGLARSPWPGLADDYYERKVSPDLMPLARKIFESSDGFDLCQGRSEAEMLFQSRYGAGCELLFVTDSEKPEDFENLGFDICLSHEWNLILSGIAVQHRHFGNLESIFNSYGLISKFEDSVLYIQRYRETMSENPDEGPEIFDERTTPYVVRIFRVH